MLRTPEVVLPGLATPLSHRGGLTGKLSVPVRPASVIHAQLRHVIGVSSADGREVPLLKLQMLDSLIESYLRVQTHPARPEGEGLGVPVSSRTIDTTIAAVSADLHETLRQRSDRPAGGVAEPGAALNLGV